MLRFKKFLTEGGNLPIPHLGNRVSDSVDSSRRDQEAPQFHEFFNSVDSAFHKQHGHSLFGNSLKTGSAYAGSSRPYMDTKNISTERFKNAKPSMGDFDVQTPEAHKQKVKEFLTNNKGKSFGKFNIIHTASGAQNHAIVQHQDTGKLHQVDFEPVEYDEKTKEPTAFSQMAHNSHINDMEQGLKGVWHKKLLGATLHAHSTPGIISTTKGAGKNKVETQTEGHYSPHSFSVDKGVRPRYETIGHSGETPIVREIKKPEASHYTRDLPTIYHHMFGRHPSAEDVNDIHSFGGVVKHIKQHIPEEKHQHIVNKFVEGLWHPSSQAISVNPTEDQKHKDRAYEEIKKHFPAQAIRIQKQTEAQRSAYYDKTNPSYKFKTAVPRDEDSGIKESVENHHRVVFAAGRFTGPTEEHHKLLSKVFNTPGDSHRVYVMGPSSVEKTTDKDPLTVGEKVDQLKKLYPQHADSFIAGDHRHTANPQKALVHTWHSLQQPGRKVHLTVIAGSGDEGIKNKSSAGGSLEGYKSLVDKYNKTKFPQSTDENGNVRGGDTRMDYETTNFVENPRGKTSGSVMRNAARTLDHNNKEHVSQFKKMLHPDFSHEDAQKLMKTIKERSKPVTESLLNKIRKILDK